MAKQRLSLNEDEICLVHIVLDTIRLKGWEKSGLGSMTFEDLCKLDSKLDKWVHLKVFGDRWDDEQGWISPEPIHDEFNPTYDTDEWQ